MASAAAVVVPPASLSAPSRRSPNFLPSPRSIPCSNFSSSLRVRPSFFSTSTSSLRATRHAPISASVQQVDVSKVVPQADRVLVKLEELPEKSVGGVLLPKSAVKFEHYLCGEVISAGKEAGSVTPGQKVLFSDFNAYEVNLGTSERLCFVKLGDLLAFIE